MNKTEIQNLVKEIGAYDSNYDNYIMTEQDISILADELLAKINYTRCSTQLLCVNKEDDNAITKGYSYECIEEDNTFYKIVDNYGSENWFLKEYFKKAISKQQLFRTTYSYKVT